LTAGIGRGVIYLDFQQTLRPMISMGADLLNFNDRPTGNRATAIIAMISCHSAKHVMESIHVEPIFIYQQ
jgi:hypothetical protein